MEWGGGGGGGGGRIKESLGGVCHQGSPILTLFRQNLFILLPCLRQETLFVALIVVLNKHGSHGNAF